MFFGCYFNVLRHRGRVYSLLRSLLKNDIFACVQLVNPSPQVSICDARFSSSFFFYYLKCFKGLVTLLSSFISARNVWISDILETVNRMRKLHTTNDFEDYKKCFSFSLFCLWDSCRELDTSYFIWIYLYGIIILTRINEWW